MRRDRGLLESGRILYLPVGQIHPNPSQPRKIFDADGLQELAGSIRTYGILQPLTVRRRNGEYELVAGERRLRAAKIAGMTEVPCILLTVDEEQSGMVALVENLQRRDLDYIEEAQGLARLMRQYGLNQEQAAARVGKSQSAVANKLRLLRHSPAVLSALRENGLSERHARALLKLEDGGEQLQFAKLAAQSRWSVRQLEAQIAHNANAARTARPELRLIRDNRLVINALNDTVRQLKRIGVHASSRVEAHGDSYDVIITVRRPYDADT